MKSIKAFLLDESGAAAIEYGMILASVSLVVVAAASLAGASFELFFGEVSEQVLQAGLGVGESSLGSADESGAAQAGGGSGAGASQGAARASETGLSRGLGLGGSKS